jgi:peptidoglycan/LPS O-acetylase OafA/YrhL
VRSRAAALLLIASGVIVSNLESRVAHYLGYPALLGYSAWFCMGVAAYSISKRARATLSPKLYGCVLTVFAFSPCITHQVFSGPRSGWMLIAMGAVFALALPYFSEISSPVVKKISHLVATYSYGIYLTHVPILWFAFRQLANEPLWLRIALCAGLMAVVPMGLYHAVELPLIRAGGRIADKLGRRKITSAMSASA